MHPARRWGCPGYRTGSGHGARARRPVGPAEPRPRRGAQTSAEGSDCARERAGRARNFCSADLQSQRDRSAPRITPSAQHLRAHWWHPCEGSLGLRACSGGYPTRLLQEAQPSARACMCEGGPRAQSPRQSSPVEFQSLLMPEFALCRSRAPMVRVPGCSRLQGAAVVMGGAVGGSP